MGKLLAVFIFALSLTVTPVHAQSLAGTPAPPVQIADVNGVDLMSGGYTHPAGNFGIGLAERPTFSLNIGVGGFLAPGGTPDYRARVYKEPCIDEPQKPIYCTFSIYVDYQDGVEKFSNSTKLGNLGGTFSLTSSEYIVTKSDGSIWRFSRNGYDGNAGVNYTLGIISSITRPDGTILTYTSGKVTSNDGYAMTFGTNKFINTTIDPCDINGCSIFTVNWPSFTANGNGQSTVYTDAGGNVSNANRFSSGGVTQFDQTTATGVPYSWKMSTWYGSRYEFFVIAVSSFSGPSGQTSYSYTVNNYSQIQTAQSTNSLGGKITMQRVADSAYELFDENNNKTTYAMDAWSYDNFWNPQSFRLNRITYPEGSSVSYTRDSRGNVKRVDIRSKTGDISTSTASFDETCLNYKICNKPKYVLDFLGNKTDYTYHADSGNLASETAPAGIDGIRPQIRYQYTQLNSQYRSTNGGTIVGSPIWRLASKSKCQTQASCAGTRDEVITRYTYNENLLPVSETVSLGDGTLLSQTTKSYDKIGNVIAVDGPMPGTGDNTRYVYDAKRLLVAEIRPDPDGAGSLTVPVTRYTHDADGRLTAIAKGTAANQSDAALAGMVVIQTAATEYNSLGHKAKATVSADNSSRAVAQYSYDALGRLQCAAIRMNPAVFGSLPASACSPGTEGQQGSDRITKNIYDAAGQLIQVRKAVGTPLEQAYATYTYTANGKQEYVTDAKGNRSRFIYDSFDRLFQWNFPEKNSPGATSASDYEAYHYDANGNRTYKRTRAGQDIHYSYDALNRMTVKNLPGTTAGDVYYGYDLRGLQTYARFGSSGGEGISNSWDGLGRLASSTTTMGGASRTLSYQYDANGNRTRLTFPDGQFFTYGSDGLDRMTAIHENGGTQVASFSYNNRGERTGIGGGFNTGFSYDGIGRLAGITHDMAGTGQDVTFCMGTLSGATCNPSYNAASQILNRSVSNSAYGWNGHANVNRGYAVNGLNQYTAAGSAAFTYDPNGNLTADGGTTYAYDVENRLLSASGANSATLSWDPMGRLYQTTGSATTRFLYDGDELVGEYDTGGNLLRRYVHGSGTDDPLVWYEGSGLGDRRHLRTDHQGSIVAIGSSAGSSIAINSYDEYGIPGRNNAGRFAYTGQIRIPELGMYHYKARIYSPTLGRFLQTDPIGYEDQINLYAYVTNDPINNVDPDGQVIETVWDVANIAMGVASAAGNVAAGNYGKAAVDVVGVVVDTAAAVVPGVPGGAGTAIKVARGAERASEGARAATRVERTASGRRVGDFTRSERNAAKSENAAQNGGRMACTDCKKPLENVQSQKGVPTPSNQAQVHHNPPISQGGGRDSKAEVLCPKCHQERHRNE